MRDRWNPYELVACAPNARNGFGRKPPAGIPVFASYEEVRELCERGLIDIVVLADGRCRENDMFTLARACEKTMVDLMVIPWAFNSSFRVELTTISGVPLLGYQATA